ncbi:unnamed protein product [Cuscuta epithymum]|nr:unnamed protein product [Cuscuta epithymum]
MAEVGNRTYPINCFLNVDVPTDVLNHKGYRLTKQGKSFVKLGWKQITSETQGGKMLSTMTMDQNSTTSVEPSDLSTQNDSLIFQREVREAQIDTDDADYYYLQQGYITVTPLGALSNAEIDGVEFFKEWLPSVSESSFSKM